MCAVERVSWHVNTGSQSEPDTVSLHPGMSRCDVNIAEIRSSLLRILCPPDQASLNEVARSQQLDLDDVCRTTALLRSHPSYNSRIDFVEMLRDTITADRRGLAQRPTNL
jgi:hypothetical protein